MSITEPPQNVTGAALRAMRVGVGIPLRTMAVMVGCSHSHLARVESGVRALTPDLAVRIPRAVADHLKKCA